MQNHWTSLNNLQPSRTVCIWLNLLTFKERMWRSEGEVENLRGIPPASIFWRIFHIWPIICKSYSWGDAQCGMVGGIFCQEILDSYFHRHYCPYSWVWVSGCLSLMPLDLGCLWLPLSWFHAFHATSAASLESHVGQPLATVPSGHLQLEYFTPSGHYFLW